MKKSTLHAKKQNEAVVRITAQYVEQVQAGLRPSLSDYLVRYPAYTDALVDFVAYYHAFEEHALQKTASGEALSEISQVALERAWRHVYLSEDNRSCQILTLLVKRDRRLSLSYLAKELDLSVDVVMQLEQRRIDPASIPLELSRRMARVIQQPLHVIQTYLAGNSQHHASGKSKSTGTQQRVAERQETYSMSAREGVLSFRQALIASVQLSDRQKDNWFRIIEHENM